MTIKWVQVDPLVMNGEPFCYGTRLTVRNILELRSNGYTLPRMLKEHPELRRMGVAAAYSYAARNRVGPRLAGAPSSELHRGFTFPPRPAARMTPSTSHKGDGTK
jgi:uncharacterized protein (DUF433 family)